MSLRAILQTVLAICGIDVVPKLHSICAYHTLYLVALWRDIMYNNIGHYMSEIYLGAMYNAIPKSISL